MRPLVVAGVTAAATGLLAGGLAYASLYPTSEIFGRVLLAGEDPQQLALTYDDGPNPAATPELLDLLARSQVRATFFLIGEFVRQQPVLARAVAEAGHLIGNHTMTHPRLATQTGARIRAEIGDANRLIEDVTGAAVRYFRPPHGSRRPYVLRAARELGLTTVLWNVAASDWNPVDAPTIAAAVDAGVARNRKRGRGSNILLHDGGHLGLGADRLPTVAASADLVRRYRADRFVTVDAWG